MKKILILTLILLMCTVPYAKANEIYHTRVNENGELVKCNCHNSFNYYLTDQGALILVCNDIHYKLLIKNDKEYLKECHCNANQFIMDSTHRFRICSYEIVDSLNQK